LAAYTARELTGKYPDLPASPKTGMTKPLTLWDMHTVWIKVQQLRTIKPALKGDDGVWAGAFRSSAWSGRTWGSAKVGSGMLDGLAEGLFV
jgi:hypothetical protein